MLLESLCKLRKYINKGDEDYKKIIDEIEDVGKLASIGTILNYQFKLHSSQFERYINIMSYIIYKTSDIRLKISNKYSLNYFMDVNMGIQDLFTTQGFKYKFLNMLIVLKKKFYNDDIKDIIDKYKGINSGSFVNDSSKDTVFFPYIEPFMAFLDIETPFCDVKMIKFLYEENRDDKYFDEIDDKQKVLISCILDDAKLLLKVKDESSKTFNSLLYSISKQNILFSREISPENILQAIISLDFDYLYFIAKNDVFEENAIMTFSDKINIPKDMQFKLFNKYCRELSAILSNSYFSSIYNEFLASRCDMLNSEQILHFDSFLILFFIVEFINFLITFPEDFFEINEIYSILHLDNIKLKEFFSKIKEKFKERIEFGFDLNRYRNMLFMNSAPKFIERLLKMKGLDEIYPLIKRSIIVEIFKSYFISIFHNLRDRQGIVGDYFYANFMNGRNADDNYLCNSSNFKKCWNIVYRLFECNLFILYNSFTISYFSGTSNPFIPPPPSDTFISVDSYRDTVALKVIYDEYDENEEYYDIYTKNYYTLAKKENGSAFNTIVNYFIIHFGKYDIKPK